MAASSREEGGPGGETGEGAGPVDTPTKRKAEAWDQVRLAAPVCVGFLCKRFISTTAIVLVGRQGATQLAAAGLAVSIANVSGYSVLVGVSSTLQTTAGQAFGAQNFQEVSLTLQRCVLLCTLMYGAIAALWLNASALLRLVGQEEDISDLAARYLVLLLPGAFGYMVSQCLQNWLSAQRVTKPTGTGGMMIAITYLPLCWSMVYPAGLNFEGAAVATSIADLALMLWMLVNTRYYLRTRLQSSWQNLSRGALSKWGPFLRLALPNFLMISEWWASEITVLMAGLLPQPHLSLAALAMFSNTCSICFMTPLSLGIAANTRVSNELGAGRPIRARHAACTSVLLGLVVMAAISCLVLAGRQVWVRLFSSDAAVIEHALPVMVVAAVYVIADGMSTVLSGPLKGCGRQPVLALIIVAAYYIGGLPCSWLLAWRASMSTLGLAIGSAAGTYLHCLGVSLVLLTTRWAAMARQAQERQAESLLRRDGPAS